MAVVRNQHPEQVGSREFQHELLNHWGNTLLDEARTQQGEAAADLFKAAYKKYEQALEIKPDTSEALVGLGCARLALASQDGDADSREKLLRLARESLLAAQELSAKAAAYNLGCQCALAGDLDECRQWLEASKAAGHLPPREQLLGDPDLEIVRGETWFSELLG